MHVFRRIIQRCIIRASICNRIIPAAVENESEIVERAAVNGTQFFSVAGDGNAVVFVNADNAFYFRFGQIQAVARRIPVGKSELVFKRYGRIIAKHAQRFAPVGVDDPVFAHA